MPSSQEVRIWYNKLYASRGSQSMRPLEAYRPLVELLDAREGSTLLDVSCGSGFLLQAARERGVLACGVDLSDQAVRVAREAAPEARLAVCNGEELAFRKACFDHVTCLGSLEHFLDMGRGLREMHRVARPEARCVIMVPNRRFAGWWLLGGGTAQQDVQEEMLTLSQWRALFAQHGFTVVSVKPDLWHADKWRLRRLPPVLAQALPVLMAVAWRLLPLQLQYQFIFLLRRNAE